MMPPDAVTLTACWIVRHGCVAEPLAESEPVTATQRFGESGSVEAGATTSAGVELPIPVGAGCSAPPGAVIEVVAGATSSGSAPRRTGSPAVAGSAAAPDV